MEQIAKEENSITVACLILSFVYYFNGLKYQITKNITPVHLKNKSGIGWAYVRMFGINCVYLYILIIKADLPRQHVLVFYVKPNR